MNTHSVNVLVIDDDDTMRDVVVEALRAAGFTTRETSNGKKGLDLARELQPDLVLLDIMMPEMDGLTALQTLRKDAWGAAVPVIMLTSIDETSTILEAMKYADDYFVKTERTLDELVAKVNALIPA